MAIRYACATLNETPTALLSDSIAEEGADTDQNLEAARSNILANASPTLSADSLSINRRSEKQMNTYVPWEINPRFMKDSTVSDGLHLGHPTLGSDAAFTMRANPLLSPGQCHPGALSPASSLSPECHSNHHNDFKESGYGFGGTPPITPDSTHDGEEGAQVTVL